MKKLINLLSLVFLSTLFLSAQEMASINQEPIIDSESSTLIVRFTDLKSDKGQLMVALYSSENTWLNKSYMGETTTIENGVADVTFKNVPFGSYAVSSVHDEDMDGKLKTGLFGIPSEPYASSRGAKGRFGPPKWNDAVFTIESKSSLISIKF